MSFPQPKLTNSDSHISSLSRRRFLQTTGFLAGATLLGGRAFAGDANSKLRTAHIGVGGMGGSDLNSVSSHKLVEVAALCDVDSSRLAAASAKHPGAEIFTDYRDLLEKLGDRIDAVVVSTPDHTHAPAAMSALNMKKPVYCQKPLTHDIYEARQLRLAAEKAGVPTQMGIQVHSSSTYRNAVEVVRSGVIGKVKAVHAWSSKNWGYDKPTLNAPAEPPKNLTWNLWLGTKAERPFVNGIYHPGAWRKLIDFGTGTLGDMGVHIFDTPYGALELTAPLWVKTECREPTGVGHPEKNIVTYEFPGTKYTTDTMSWVWYDGGNAPPRKQMEFLPAGMKLPGQGALFIGEKGAILLPHVGAARIFPDEVAAEYKQANVGSNNHYHQWVDACMGEGETSASFSYGGPLTEALLLGVVANRFPGQKLMWDAKQLQVTNLPAANKLIRSEYREGFEVKGL